MSYVPQIKKIVIIGESKGVTFPKVWLDYNKKRYGREIKEVLMVESDQSLIFSPIVPSKERTRTAQTSEGETKP